MKKRGTLIRTMFVLGLLSSAVVAGLRSEWAGKKLCAEIEHRVPELAPGMKVQVGQCRLEPLELGVELRDVAVTLPRGSEPAIRADRAEVQLALLQALWGSIRLDRVELDRPQVSLDLSHLEASPDAKPKRPRSARCEVADALQQLDVHRLVLSDGTVHLLLPGGRTVDLSALEVSARGQHGVTQLRVSESGGKVTLPGGVLPLDKIVLATTLDAPAADLEVQRFQLEGGQLQLLGHGTVRDLCDPDLNVEANAGVPLDLVTMLLAQPEPPPALGKKRAPPGPNVQLRGYLSANASVQGKLDAPNAHVEADLTDFDANIDGNDVNPRELSASIDLQRDQIKISQLYWPFPEGAARISAEITRKDNWPVTIDVDARNIPFGDLLNRLPLKHPWVDFSGSLRTPHKLSGHLFPTPTFGGPVAVDVADFHVRTRPWDAPAQKDDEVLQIHRAHLDTDFNFTPDRVRLTHARLTTERGEALVEASLSTDPKKGLDLTGEITRFDLGEFGPIVGMPWAGTGTAQKIHITGAYGEQTIDGVLGVKDFSFAGVHPGDVSGAIHFDPSFVLHGDGIVASKGQTTYRGHGALDFSHGSPLAWGAVGVERGRIEDVLAILRDLHWSFEMFDGQMTGGISGTISLDKGPILAPTSDFDLHLRDVVCYARPLGDADFKMHSEDGELLEIPDTTLHGKSGTFVFGGKQVVNGALDFHLSAEGVPVDVATAPELEDWEMTGTLSGKVAIRGTQQQPEIRGEIFGSDLTMFGIPAGQAHVQVVGIGDAMQIIGPVGDDVQLWSRMRWDGELPVEAKLTFDVGDLYKYVPTKTEWSDVTGKLQGTLSLRGNMKDSSSYVGSYDFPKVEFSKGDYTEENVEPVRLDFHGDTYELKSFSFRGHGAAGATAQATELSIVGTRAGKENRLGLTVKGSLDAKLFETLSPEIDASSGHVDIAASITGTQARPIVVGSLELQRGKLKMRDWPLSLEGIDGNVQFSQASIEIPDGAEGIRGTMNGGRVALAGSVGLKHFKPASYDLRLQMDEARFHIGTFPTTTLSGALALTGKVEDPVVSGEIDVDNFVYDEDLALDRLISSATRKKLDAQTFTKRPRVVRFADLTIDLGGPGSHGRVVVKNNLVDTQLIGKLSVLGDDAHPLLRGDIEAAPGGKAFYRGNEFSLEQVLVSFRDSERITPEFDIHATTTTRDYRISLHAYGTPDATRTELSSSPDLSQGDIVTLLTLGFTSQDRSGGGNGAALGLGADVASSLLGVDRAAERFIPKNNLLKDPSFKLTSAYSQAYGSMQPTAQIEGKIVSENVRLRLQEPVVAGGRGFKMQGEYRFNDNGSVQVQLDRDNSDYNFPDVGADLKLRWEIR